jgi:hypothetical protein
MFRIHRDAGYTEDTFLTHPPLLPCSYFVPVLYLPHRFCVIISVSSLYCTTTSSCCKVSTCTALVSSHFAPISLTCLCTLSHMPCTFLHSPLPCPCHLRLIAIRPSTLTRVPMPPQASSRLIFSFRLFETCLVPCLAHLICLLISLSPCASDCLLPRVLIVRPFSA